MLHPLPPETLQKQLAMPPVAFAPSELRLAYVTQSSVQLHWHLLMVD